MILKDYSRIEKAVSLDLMQNTKVVGVGCGGAYSLYGSLTRSGLGNLKVFDFDIVEEPNIVRQGYETSQIGMKKVDALGEHLLKLNSGLRYEGSTENILDMEEAEFDAHFQNVDLLLMMTDSFKAQAMGNIISLRYGIPTMWAGFYERSECAEIVYTVPGKTPACFRCAVSPRYQVNQNEEIKISSNCNTVFHSEFLDSHAGILALAILHRDTSGYTFSNWFTEDLWERNLIQIKVNPAYESALFDRTFANTGGRTPFFTPIFQKIEVECAPKYEPCPDCGGTGNLLSMKMK